MRVIAGILGGRNFDSPRGHRTHPMSEKMRGAIFSALGDIEGLEVIDVYSGSGALAIEAISRGALHATAIDSDKQAHSTTLQNAQDLGVASQLKATQAHFASWSSRNEDKKYDIAFADPPYDDISIKDLNIIPIHVRNTGIIVLSLPGSLDLPTLDGCKMVKTKKYGDGQLVFYQKIG